MQRRFTVNMRVNIGKTDQEWIDHLVAAHHGDISLV